MKNDKIKPPNEEIEYTEEQIIELQRCSKDPIYFMKKYMKVMHPTRGAISFSMYPYQERCVKAFMSNRWNLILAGRQLGKCVSYGTSIKVGAKPTGFKRFLLRALFPRQYKLIFKN